MEHHLNAYTFVEFCHAHRISRSTLYNLFGEGLGPRVMHVRGRRLISIEAAAEWRSAMERRTNEPESAVEVANGTLELSSETGEASQ